MTPQPKIGVLTFHRCINYGSYWQARCLLEGIRARGFDPVLLNHDSLRVNLAEWKCALQPVLPARVPPRDYFLYGVKMLKFFRAIGRLPHSARFPLDDPAAMEAFDLVIVGSDEVFNLRHVWYGGKRLFYGDGVRAKRLVAYAASFGNTPAADGMETWWADRLRAFDAISVRDDNARRMIGNALGETPELVLDPCLQFMPRPEGTWQAPADPYIAVYGHNFSDRFSREVRRWATAHGLRLISIGYRNDWADENWLTAEPHEFAHFMSHAGAVATNFFHGCVFALRYAKPFVCESSSYRAIKVHDLMATVGGEHHLMRDDSPSDAYDACLGNPLESRIMQCIDQLRQTSGAYLDRVLDGRYA